MDKREPLPGDYDFDYYYENFEEIYEFSSYISTPKTTSRSLNADYEPDDDLPQFVSKYQDEQAKRAAAAEEEKREKLRKLLGLDKIKIRDSAETIITPKSSFSSLDTESSESSCNLCLKDIKVSDSQLKFLNIYNDYPVPDDPGLLSAFWTLYPSDKVYKNDGVQKFIDMIDKSKLQPIRKVGDMLQTDEIDLGFYGINPRIMKALCEALKHNTSVQSLILQDNPLSPSACYHLSDLLIHNQLLESINLSGCRIGPRGAKELIDGLGQSKSLKHLNMNKCELTDEGAAYVCDSLIDSSAILTLDISDNDLSGEFVTSLCDLLRQTETLEAINFSWNSLCTKEFWENFVKELVKNIPTQKIQFSWNSLDKKCLPFLIELLESSSITDLDISNNFLDKKDAESLAKAISKNTSLQYLSLSSNPIGPGGAAALINSLIPEISPSSQLHHLDLDNIWPEKEVIPLLEKIKNKGELSVKLGGILSNYKLIGPDPRKIFLRRANFEAMSPKKKKLRRDFGQFVLTLDDSIVSKYDFQQSVKRYKLKLSDSLLMEIMNAFEIEKNSLDQVSLKKFYLQEYPNTKPPPPKPQKGKKDKKKKKSDGDEIIEKGNIDNGEGGEKSGKKRVQLMDADMN